MPQFAFRWIHPPDQCPMTNSKVRELILAKAPALPTIAQELGVQIVAGPYVFASEHEGLIVMDAPTVEVINEFAIRSGFGQWNTIKVVLAQPIEEAMKQLDTLTPIY